MAVKYYDAAEVTVTFAGIALDSGYDDGEFLAIEQAEDTFPVRTGVPGNAGGDVARTKMPTRTVTIRIKLMQSSEGNARLSAIHELDVSKKNGRGVGQFTVRDSIGTSLFHAQAAWISRPPNVAYARDPREREWVLYGVTGERVDGTN